VRVLNEQNQTDFFYTFDSLVPGVLKKLNIFKTNYFYDDLLQIGLIKLYRAYEEFPEDLETEEGIYRFTGYAFTKVKWAVIDEMRKIQNHHARTTEFPESFQELEIAGSNQMESHSIHELDFDHFISQLTEKERNFLKDRMEKGLSITDIADKYRVSRKTIYVWRDLIAKKYQIFRGGYQ